MLRAALVTVALAAGLAVPASPAAAAGAVHFIGTAHVNCHGCGPSSGTADLTLTGATTWGVVSGPGFASFGSNTPPGAGCLLQGTASGTMTSQWVGLDFNWSRVGNIAIISTTGDIIGGGWGTIIVTSPVGNPCGGPATFTVEGWIGGT